MSAACERASVAIQINGDRFLVKVDQHGLVRNVEIALLEQASWQRSPVILGDQGDDFFISPEAPRRSGTASAKRAQAPAATRNRINEITVTISRHLSEDANRVQFE